MSIFRRIKNVIFGSIKSDTVKPLPEFNKVYVGDVWAKKSKQTGWQRPAINSTKQITITNVNNEKDLFKCVVSMSDGKVNKDIFKIECTSPFELLDEYELLQSPMRDWIQHEHDIMVDRKLRRDMDMSYGYQPYRSQPQFDMYGKQIPRKQIPLGEGETIQLVEDEPDA